MLKSISFVLKENLQNIYRIYSITRYEILADLRESKLGVFWNFANPIIQVLTYWFVFGYILDRGDIDGIPYIYWMLAGISMWFFISPSITNGCNAITSKISIITRMKLPISVFPTTVILKEFFNHIFIFLILICTVILGGFYPTIHWLGILYYMICAIFFATSLSLITSVLNMLARDTRKLILSFMRLLLYATPILWQMPNGIPIWLKNILRSNPIYYIVNGYRDCFFYHKGIGYYLKDTILFWVITLSLFCLGSFLFYKFKSKFIDMA